MHILVIGGAGYIGSMLVSQLLEAGHQVRVYDNLMFGGEALMGVYGQDNFTFVHGDIRDIDAFTNALTDNVEAVVHLAALVGDPACAENPDATRAINFQASCNILDVCSEKQIPRFLFVSTCSNYGISDTSMFADETSPLNPVSLYAETKVAAERYVLQSDHVSTGRTIFRFATVFGLSQRMRFDLLLNELVRDAICHKQLMIYGPESWRPFVHVRDAVHAILRVLNAPVAQVDGQVFNIGLANFKKKDLIEIIKKHIPDLVIDIPEHIQDKRDYKVSFDKMKQVLDFHPSVSIEQGLQELISALQHGVISDAFARCYRNVS